MLQLLPRAMPPLSMMLDDIGAPSAHAIAQALDVTPRTVERWRTKDEAPRTAALALFWITSWGASQVDARTFNDARAAWGMVRCLTDERDALRVELARVQRLAYGSANEPSGPRWGLQVQRADDQAEQHHERQRAAGGGPRVPAIERVHVRVAQVVPLFRPADGVRRDDAHQPMP